MRECRRPVHAPRAVEARRAQEVALPRPAKPPNGSPDLDHCKHLRHTATMARNKVMDVSAQPSSTTARTIMLSNARSERKGSISSRNVRESMGAKVSEAELTGHPPACRTSVSGGRNVRVFQWPSRRPRSAPN